MSKKRTFKTTIQWLLIFSGAIVLAVFAIVAAFNVSLNMNQGNEMSQLSLANVEALAGARENGSDFFKVQEKSVTTWQTTETVHYAPRIDEQFQIEHEQTDCSGSGSIDCSSNYTTSIKDSDFVKCTH